MDRERLASAAISPTTTPAYFKCSNDGLSLRPRGARYLRFVPARYRTRRRRSLSAALPPVYTVVSPAILGVSGDRRPRLTMTTLTFDKLAYVDRLTAAGFSEQQARAMADSLDTALRE